MAEWLTYSLSDILPFSREAYYRLFALHNDALWPTPIVTAVLGFGLVALVLRDGRQTNRPIAGVLAGCWLLVAWAFHWERYTPINQAAPYFAAGFALQALLVAWFGVARGSLRFRAGRDIASRVGLSLVLFAVVAHPLIGVLVGRAWGEAAIFGIAPDPTVVATFGLLLIARGWVRWALLPIPVIWCAINGAIAWTLDAWDGAIAPSVAVLVLAGLTARGVIRSRDAMAAGPGGAP
jgi:hypothetical protein